MTAPDPRLDALFALFSHLSFQQGDFVLSSGKRATFYMDGRMTTLSAEGSRLIGEILFERIAPLGISAVGGLTLGADPIVSAITLTSALKGEPINGFLIRKEAKGHGTGRQVEGHLKPGDRVVLVEDVITTGGSFIKAVEAIRNSVPDVEIVALFALVDRNEGASEALSPLGIPVHTLFPIQQFLAAGTSASLAPGL